MRHRQQIYLTDDENTRLTGAAGTVPFSEWARRTLLTTVAGQPPVSPILDALAAVHAEVKGVRLLLLNLPDDRGVLAPDQETPTLKQDQARRVVQETVAWVDEEKWK